MQFKSRSKVRLYLFESFLEILQHLLIAFAFILFFAYAQVSVADSIISVSCQLASGSHAGAFLLPVLGVLCLGAAMAIRTGLFNLKKHHDYKMREPL